MTVCLSVLSIVFISQYAPQSHKFELYRHNPSDPNSLSSNFVWAIWEAYDRSVWIGRNDKPAEFNLSRLIQININLHRTQAEIKGIEISCSQADDVKAFGDREMINTVVRNLISNAVKFSEKGDEITIRINRKDKMLEVLVTDEGIGIMPDNLDKLFRIDQKFKTNGTANEKGTGLGLILAREFVQKNGGEMIAESVFGKGSTFGFTLPASG
jgi:signal transduction histidine kinase